MVLRGAACSLPPAVGDVLAWIGRYLPRRTVATSYNLVMSSPANPMDECETHVDYHGLRWVCLTVIDMRWNSRRPSGVSAGEIPSSIKVDSRQVPTDLHRKEQRRLLCHAAARYRKYQAEEASLLPGLTPQASNRHNAGSRIPLFVNCDVQPTAEEGGTVRTMGHVRLLVPGSCWEGPGLHPSPLSLAGIRLIGLILALDS